MADRRRSRRAAGPPVVLLSLSRTPGTTPLGVLSGTGAIGANSNKYVGSLIGIGLGGSFNGAFYGPKAAETGCAFSATSGPNTAAGVFVGKQ